MPLRTTIIFALLALSYCSAHGQGLTCATRGTLTHCWDRNGTTVSTIEQRGNLSHTWDRNGRTVETCEERRGVTRCW
jgi:hypothetical protein